MSSTKKDKLRDEVMSLTREKELYENAAKESLRRALEEKVEAVQKLSDVERSLETTEEEAARLRERCEQMQSELGGLIAEHAQAIGHTAELDAQLKVGWQRALRGVESYINYCPSTNSRADIAVCICAVVATSRRVCLFVVYYLDCLGKCLGFLYIH